MAETYKGLTIRIGGETTGLQRALKSADSAIASTNTQLRKMTQALKMDPSSTKALNSQLDLMGDKAVQTANRVSKLQDALRKVSSDHVEIDFGDDRIETTIQTVRQLMQGTADVSERAADAAARYNDVNAELEKLYRSINKAAQASDEFGEEFDLRDHVDDIDILSDRLIEMGAATEKDISKLKALRSVWEEAFTENEIGKALTKVRDLENELTKAEAAARKAAQEFVRMSLETSRMELSGDLDRQLERVQASAKDATTALQRAEQALKIDPGNADAAVEAMRQLQQSATLAQRKLELMESKLSRLDTNGIGAIASSTDDAADAARVAAQRFEELTVQVDKAKADLKELSDTQKHMSDRGETQTDEYRQLSVQIQNATNEVRELEAAQRQARDAAETAQQVQEYRELEGQIAQTRAELSQYNAEAKSLTSPGKMLSSNTLMELGMTLSTSVTPAIVAMGAYAIDAANDIDSAYRDMRKTVNGTEEDFEALRQAAVDFSTTHVTSADQILAIQAIGGELGVAVDDLETFATTVSNLEVATDLDADEAATALGQLDNIMSDLNGSTMPAFSDALVRLGNNGASTESQIVEIAKRIGAMGSIVGMSTPEVLAWASSIASTGQNAEAAGTAISNTMSDLETAVAGGGEALEAFAQVSGMSAQQFADTWNADPSTAMKSFIEGLVRIEDSGGSADATLQDLGITAVRQKQAIEGLMQTIGGLDENLQMSNNAWNGVSDQWGEAGDAANEAEKKAEGFSGAISRMQNVAQVLASELGESLTPMIDAVADALGELGQWFASMPDSFKQFVAGAGAITAALGPFLLFSRAISSMKKDLTAFRTTMSAVSSALGVAESSTSALTGTLGGLKGGLVGLGVAVAAVGLTAFISTAAEAAREAENFSKATDGLADATDRAQGLNDLTVDIEDYGNKANEASKSADELAESIAKSVDTINENTAAAETQVAQLTAAQQIINKYAGQTDLTADAQGRLEWAIGLVNDQLGLSITATDVANDSYTNQEGVVSDLTDTINGLIEAKKNEAKVNAYQENLTELYKQQIDAADTLVEKQKAFNEQVEWYQRNGDFSYDEAVEAAWEAPEGKELKESQEMFDGLNESIRVQEGELGSLVGAASEAADAYDALSGSMDSGKFALFSAELADSGTSFDMLSDDLRELGAGTIAFSQLSSEQLSELASAYNGQADSIKDKLAELNVSTTETRNAMVDSFASLGAEVPAYLESLGYNLDDLAGYLIMAGVSTEQLASLGVSNFNALATEAGGDINTLIALITGYNNTPIIDKHGNITTEYTTLRDANGQIYIWNGSVLKTINGEVIADSTTLQPTIEEMGLYQDITLDNKTTTVSTDYGGDASPGEAAGAVDDLRARGDDTITTTVKTEYVTTYRSYNIGGASTFGSGSTTRPKKMAPAPSSLQSLAAAANMSSAADTGISLMSDTATQAAAAASRAKAAIAPLAARASDIARNLSVTVERSSTAGAVRSMARNMTRTPPYPGSGIRETGGGAVNITIDGIGTTGRVQSIALDLLDELERVGAI